MNHHPLHLDAEAVVFLLHLGVGRVFDLPLVALVLISLTSEVYGRRFVHVIFALVVSEHHLTMHFQLENTRNVIRLNITV